MTLAEANRITRSYSDLVGAKYYALFHDELDQKAFDRGLLDSFAARLPRAGRVLDAGCGPCGHTVQYLAQHDLHVTGVDISAVCIELAKHACPRADFSVMDMSSLGFPSGTFDGLLSYYSIIYTPKKDLPAVAEEFLRVLRPGGILLLAVKEGEGEGLIADPLGFNTTVYFTSFHEGELNDLFSAHGFGIIQSLAMAPLPSEIQQRRLYILARKLPT